MIRKIRIVTTVGFSVDQTDYPEAAGAFIKIALAKLMAGPEPTMMVGKPENECDRSEDEGRTIQVPLRFNAYAIRDDHPKECDCGCGGGSIVTFLRPDEY